MTVNGAGGASSGHPADGHSAVSNSLINPKADVVTLVVHADATFQYNYAPGYRPAVVGYLRQIADQIEAGTAKEWSDD